VLATGRGSLAHVAVAVVFVVVACGGSDRRTLTVFAASSLTDVFIELETAFEREHPDVDVVVSIGGSSSLAAQIEDGAPADVFAAADTRTMQRVADAGLLVEAPRVFARNRLAIAVEPGNPLDITGLDDLRDAVVVLAAPEVPAGAYADQLLDLAGVDLVPASYEQSVRAVATKVAIGEADAGIVYRTDIIASDGQLDEVVIPDDQNVSTRYPIAVTTAGPDATDFVALVLGPIGQTVISAAGFELP
jgi:molybdate transport system substrate-binding protein